MGHSSLGGEVSRKGKFGSDVVGGNVVHLDVGEVLAGVKFAKFLWDGWGGAGTEYWGIWSRGGGHFGERRGI